MLAMGAVAVLLVGCGSGDDDGANGIAAAEAAATSPAQDAGGASGDVADGVSRERVDAVLTEIDGFVEAEMELSGVPGVAVAVVYDDEVVFGEGYGVREVGTEDPITPETVFQLASLSKPITATAVARLVSEGVISWDEPVHPYAPDLLFSDPWVTDHVTFADLYSHRTGLPGDAGNTLEAIGFTRDEILARLRLVPLDPFRASYSYSNFGLTAGGDAAAKAAGVSFEDLMDERLFDLAGMTSSSARYADFEAQPDRATIHALIDGEWVPGPTRNPDAQGPAGGITSSLDDVATWTRLQLGAGTLDGEEIVGEEALSETHAPHIIKGPAPYDGQHQSYALGWTTATDHLGELRWSHSGAFSQGAHTSVTLLPEEGLGVVVLTNGMPVGTPEAITDQIIDEIVVGEQTQDWHEVWSGRFSTLFLDDATLDDVPDPATPALTNAAYLGSYANDFYGTFEVVADGDGLAVVQGPAQRTFPLTHWDANTFTFISDPELPQVRSRFEFTIGPDGQATAITIPDVAGLGTLQRV